MAREKYALMRRNGGLEHATGSLPVCVPPADVTESGDAFTLALEMPGAERASISVALSGGVLEVRAHPAALRGEGETVVHREIRRGAFERVFRLGSGIDTSAIEARYDNGVLAIRLPKTGDVRPKEITIQ